MSELKTTLNLRLTADANVSLTLTQLIDDDDLRQAAWDAGRRAEEMARSWALGYDGEELEI